MITLYVFRKSQHKLMVIFDDDSGANFIQTGEAEDLGDLLEQNCERWSPQKRAKLMIQHIFVAQNTT